MVFSDDSKDTSIAMDKSLGFVLENGLAPILCSKYWKILLNVVRYELRFNDAIMSCAVGFYQIFRTLGYEKCTISDKMKWKLYSEVPVLVYNEQQCLKYDLKAFLFGVDGFVEDIINKQHIVQIEYSKRQLKIILS